MAEDANGSQGSAAEVRRKLSLLYSCGMSETNTLSFDTLLEILAEKLATRLVREPGRLYPRLLTVDQSALYLGPAWEDVLRLAHSGKIPAVSVAGRIFLDRHDLDKWIDDNKTGWV